ncbi:hypothetical protein CK203_016785 [Vitis vinifera]|uniref:DOG1 domain-containing protein n=1 Tax=Vitis vinifera TaxID=29760 RepID=A0A438J2M4_VITVI|nr:hypothetical protein CK203_016785 [Vitis vinifera]
MPPANNNPNSEPFEIFFRGWLVRHEEVRLLLQQADERDCDETREDEEARVQELIGRVVAHYAEYYKAKQRVVREDVMTLFEPPWLTPLSEAYFGLLGSARVRVSAGDELCERPERGADADDGAAEDGDGGGGDRLDSGASEGAEESDNYIAVGDGDKGERVGGWRKGCGEGAN